MGDKLNILVLESEPGAAVMAEREIREAGHTVLRCHEPGSAAFPCNALRVGGGCPLDDHTIDVALDVRRRPRPQPTGLEDGVSCALRRHIPVVVAGSAVMNPFDDYAAETLSRTFDVVATCERVAREPLDEHSVVAAAALRAVVERRDFDLVPEVTVCREEGSLIITVRNSSELDASTRSVGAVRMTSAVRAIDPHARRIDVRFSD